MKNIKENIEIVLLQLKQMGFDRPTIEKDLGYSNKYINQILSKGGNLKVLNNLIRYKKEKLQNATKFEISTEDKSKAYDSLFSVIVAELAALKAEKTGEPVQSIIKKLYKAAEDVQP